MDPRSQTPWPRAGGGIAVVRFLRNLPNFVRLYWRLLCDRRVSVWPKAMLLLSGLYLVSPVDFIPDVLPFVGEVDDLLILLLACRLFIYLCPADVVREHVHRIDVGS